MTRSIHCAIDDENPVVGAALVPHIRETMSTPKAPLVITDYVTAPRLSVSSAVSLGIALLTVVPKPAPQPVRVAAKRLRVSVVELQHAWGHELDASVADTLPREADLRVDRAMRATSLRLEAYALLSPEHVPAAATAKTALGRLFPQGLRFLNLPYEEQWAYGQRIIEALDGDEALATDVDALVGEEIVSELRAAQAAYGKALGITVERKKPVAVALGERLSAVREAVVGYALQIVAMQDVDAGRVEVARKALGPIDELREKQARRGGAAGEREGDRGGEVVEAGAGTEGTVTPATPVPVVEDAEEGSGVG